MAILIDENSKVVVQGITGKNGQFHSEQMLDYGTKIIGGVTPGKGGQETLDLPIWDTMDEAVDAGANVSCIFVPPAFAADAIMEAAGAGIEQHVHYHLLPRWNGDTNFITTIANTRAYPADFNEIFDKLKSNAIKYFT